MERKKMDGLSREINDIAAGVVSNQGGHPTSGEGLLSLPL
jgi:hypothetical protein